MAVSPASSNIVRLPSAAGRGERPAALTGDERDAFRRIAQALREVMPGRPGDDGAPPQKQVREASVTPAPRMVPIRLLDRLPVGLLVFRERTVLFASRGLLDQLGYDDVAAFAAAGGADALFAEPMAGDVFDDQRRLLLRAADGEQIAAEAKLHIVPWEDGPATMLSIRQEERRPAHLPVAPPELLRLAAVGAPEEHRRLEDFRDALQRIEELEAVLDTATDGVVVIDGAGRITSANRSAEALFGVEATDMLGRPFADFLAEESRRSALDYLDGLARNGVASVLNDGREVIGLVPQGGMIPLFMTMGRLGDSDTFCAVLRDITQWKNAEEELVAARRAAESANQQKSEFLAKVSHEIRTPLNAVIGFAEVMLEERFGPVGNKRYREYLADIRLSGTHLMSLINDLLDLSKIEAGKLDLALDEIPLNDIIRECVGLMQPQANRDRVIIRTSLSLAVPKVVADLRSLRQILLNLLSNAVKFTPAGGQVIISSALEDNGEVVVRIRDTGVGMSQKELEIALKPFRQVATAGRPRIEGTGLGLPLTKALVEANRASFEIDSAPNQGTMVRITFPVTRVLAG
ncbi:MAG: PAS domain S-box protein [Bauldia sp.]|nr:PAS domain S-box protein [Bauldia sp.]